jgi:O-antigen ligase
MPPRSLSNAAGRIAALSAIAVLQLYWYQQPGPLPLKALTATVTAICLASPTVGLMVLSAVAPVSSTVAGLAGGPGMGTLLLEQLVLAVGAGALVRPGEAGQATRIGVPALVVAVIALVSAASMVPAAAAATAPPGLENDQYTFLRLLLNGRSARYSSVWAPLFAAITIAECALLGWITERTVRRGPQLAAWLVAISLIGHAGAAGLNIERIVRMAMVLGGGIEWLPRMLMTARVSLQIDVHAAASALLLAGVAGFGLMTGSRTRRAAIGVLLVLIAIGLWLTGSRVAILLGIVSTVGTLGWSVARTGRRRLIVAAGALLIIGVAGWLTTMYPASRYSERSTSSRLVLMNAGIQMFKQAPVFGIGIARFYGTSAGVDPEIPPLVGHTGENAHNNFIQVLAEQGVVGLGAMLWWLGVVFLTAGRAQHVRPDALRSALLVAIGACIGTWLTGHPLLVPEFAFVFWLYCGIVVAMKPAPPPDRSRWLAWLLAAAVLVSMPLRAAALRNAADLDHLGFGLSLWQHDDTQRYREARATFSVFLPVDDRPVALPMRRAPGAADPLVVEVRVRGRRVTTITVGGDEWHEPRIPVPRGWRRFERADFAVRRPPGSETTQVLLRVGRAGVR